MSYADLRRPRGPALGAALIIQGAIGYALIAGLAYTRINGHDEPIKAFPVPVPPRPQPISPKPEPKQKVQIEVDPQPRPSSSQFPQQHDVTINTGDIQIPRSDPGPTSGGDLGPVSPPQPPANPIDLSTTASPAGDQGSWFPQGAYPGGALSRGAEGRVSVSVSIGIDGRVTDCAVTESSGDHDLDAATCRLARRNGRFTPAHDRAGHPIASTAAVRNVHWLINGD